MPTQQRSYGQTRPPPIQTPKRLRDYLNQTSWSGSPRATLLAPQLHINNMKSNALHRDFIYPNWWGHQEYRDLYIKKAEEEKATKAQLQQTTNAQLQQTTTQQTHVEIAMGKPAAGLKSVNQGPVFAPTCHHFPKKMVDEITQTDATYQTEQSNDVCYKSESIAAKLKEKPASRIPVRAGFSGFMTGSGPIETTPASPQTMEINEMYSPHKRQHVPRVSTKKTPGPPPAVDVSVHSVGSTITEKSSNIPMTRTAKPSSSDSPTKNELSSFGVPPPPRAPVKTATPVKKEAAKPIQQSPMPERKPPPADGVFALCTNFLNGPIVEMLDLDRNVPKNIGESLLLDTSKSVWLEDLSNFS